MSRNYLLSDCSRYTNDDEVHKSFPFLVDFSSSKKVSATTYGEKNANGNINYLKIVNQEYVPWSVFCLEDLQKLDVRKTKFHDFNYKLPIAIERLASSLTHLSIHDTIITHLPEQIGKLKHLQWLELSNTGLMTLPDSIGKLSSLVYLYLPHNKLTSLPTTITNTRSLHTLILNNNVHLRSIHPLKGHPHLKVLKTDNCPIKHIPVNLPQLTDLYMSNNSLTNLFGIETLGDKSNSKTNFYFNKNFIRYVSPHIEQVKKLNFLNLNGNKLYSLPLNIFKITTLRQLHIKYNYFSNEDLKKTVAMFNVTYPHSKLEYWPQKSP